MPRGFAGAKKVGEFKGGGGFQPRPRGVNYFSLKDGDTVRVRFAQMHEDIQWARKWKLAPTSNFKWGELVNAVDQNEDGTPDPGYAANLKSSFRAYPILIWRNGPVWQKKPDGSIFKDANDQKVLVNYADQVALWECSYEVYETLQALDGKYNGLMAQDFEVKRVGADKSTVYHILPEPQSPMTPNDQQLLATNRIPVEDYVKIPTYEQLQTYLNGGVAPAAQPTFQQQVNQNATGVDGQPNPFLTS